LRWLNRKTGRTIPENPTISKRISSLQGHVRRHRLAFFTGGSHQTKQFVFGIKAFRDYNNKNEKERNMAAIKIKGMSCNHCVMAVTKALGGIDGVSNVKVDLAKGEATFDETKPVDRAIIRERIKKAGFEVA
jgi:copper chaperone